MLRKLAALVVCALAVLAFPADAAKPDASVPVTIMTQNMDDGTDLTYVIAALLPDPLLPLGFAVDLTHYELMASAIPERVGVMASEIAYKKPHLVAVQEAALWRTGPSPETATQPLSDSLGTLVSALKNLGVPYEIVAVNQLFDFAVQGDTLGALRFTDRNALLVRADLRPPQFHLSNVHANTFAAAFPFAGLTVPAGWITADVHVGNKQFRVVTTHLQSPISGVPEATDVQVAQAQELLHALRNLQVPVVICGDFNSDANHGGFIDSTPTVDLIEAAGYEDVWVKVYGGASGLTWPYYLEDQIPPPPFFADSPPIERIDLFFSKGMSPLGAELVVLPFGGDPVPPYASDHAGVIATFKP
jgi:endonuclease/exonuclease/phosphatase family metal-dependent hydrolase